MPKLLSQGTVAPLYSEDHGLHRAANELRKTLVRASRHRTALEASTNNLARYGRPEDANKVERCLEEAAGDADLVEEDIGRAQEAVKQWRVTAEGEAKLLWVLMYGDSSNVLARAIQVSIHGGGSFGVGRIGKTDQCG